MITARMWPPCVLGVIFSIGAILISGCVLISPNRKNTDAGIRAELD